MNVFVFVLLVLELVVDGSRSVGSTLPSAEDVFQGVQPVATAVTFSSAWPSSLHIGQTGPAPALPKWLTEALLSAAQSFDPDASPSPLPSNSSSSSAAATGGCWHIYYDVEPETSPDFQSPIVGTSSLSPAPYASTHPPALPSASPASGHHSPSSPFPTSTPTATPTLTPAHVVSRTQSHQYPPYLPNKTTSTATATATATPTSTKRNIVVDGDDQDCVVGAWVVGNCSAKCGGGVLAMTRTVVTAPQGQGAACPILRMTLACNTNACPSTDDPPVDGCLCTGGTTNVTVNKTGGDDPTTPPTYVVVPVRNGTDLNSTCLAANASNASAANATYTPNGWVFTVNVSSAGSYALCIARNGTVTPYPVPLVIGGVQSVAVDGQTCVANGSTIDVDNTAEKQVQVVGLNMPSTVQFTVVPTGTPCPGNGSNLRFQVASTSTTATKDRLSVLSVSIPDGLAGPLTLCYLINNTWDAFPTCIVAKTTNATIVVPAGTPGNPFDPAILVPVASVLGGGGVVLVVLIVVLVSRTPEIVAGAAVPPVVAAAVPPAAPPPPADFAGHVTVNIGEPVGSSAVPAPQPSHPLLVPEPESALPALPSATPADPVSVPAIVETHAPYAPAAVPRAEVPVAATNPLRPPAPVPPPPPPPQPILPPPVTNTGITLRDFPMGPPKKEPELSVKTKAVEKVFPAVYSPVAIQPVYPEVHLAAAAATPAPLQPVYPEVSLVGTAHSAAAAVPQAIQPTYPEVNLMGTGAVSPSGGFPAVLQGARVQPTYPEVLPGTRINGKDLPSLVCPQDVEVTFSDSPTSPPVLAPASLRG